MKTTKFMNALLILVISGAQLCAATAEPECSQTVETVLKSNHLNGTKLLDFDETTTVDKIQQQLGDLGVITPRNSLKYEIIRGPLKLASIVGLISEPENFQNTKKVFDKIETYQVNGRTYRLYVNTAKNKIAGLQILDLPYRKGQISQVGATYLFDESCSVNKIVKSFGRDKNDVDRRTTVATPSLCANLKHWEAKISKTPKDVHDRRTFEQDCNLIGGRMIFGKCVCPDSERRISPSEHISPIDSVPQISGCANELPETQLQKQLRNFGGDVFEPTQDNLKVLLKMCLKNEYLFPSAVLENHLKRPSAKLVD